MSISALFETHLTVSDLDRSVGFYRDVVGLPLALALPERGAAFLWIGGPGRGMLGLWSLGSAPIGVSLHIAFSVPVGDVLTACDALRAHGVTPRSFDATETDEPSVLGWMPAAAVYFRDPDGHLLEYLAMLDEPPQPERGIVPWSRWAPAEPVRIDRHVTARSELRTLFEEAEDSAVRLDAYIDDGDVLVARRGDRTIGHLQLVAVGETRAEIKNMAVDAAHRGRGVGRMLIDAALALAREQHRSTLTVATASADVDNLRFYQRTGFRLRSVERDAFTAATGYAPGAVSNGIELRDRVWLDLDLGGG